MDFKAILLDLDNTLYNYEPTHKKAIETVFAQIHTNYGLENQALETAYLSARKTINIDLYGTASSHNRLLYFQRMCELLMLNPLKLSLQLYELYWETFLSHLVLYENVLEFLEKMSNIKICLVSDLTAHIQLRKIKKLNLAEKIHFIVTSEEAGHEKPHPYIFLLALKKLNLGSSEVIMIGDNYKKDILGAHRLGIVSFWLNSLKEKEDMLSGITEFSTFTELIKLLS